MEQEFDLGGGQQDSKQSLYDYEWFRQRALASIYKIGEGAWDYSDSLLLYIPGSDEEYESVQKGDSLYNKFVTTPEYEYLVKAAPEIVSQLPDSFEYIDLGPGTEHKEQIIFDEAQKQGKSFVYIPVDISERYLSLSTEHARFQGLTVRPLRSSFEELREKLWTAKLPRFISLGMTYGNSEPPIALSLLEQLVGKNDTAFIDAQIRDRVDIEGIKDTYLIAAKELVADKLGLLGIDPEKDVDQVEVTDEVAQWNRLCHVPPELTKVGIHPGDRLLVYRSLRPTLAEFKAGISSKFSRYKLIDTSDQFVGALIQGG